MSAKAGTRRVGLPRAKSTSNMVDAVGGTRETLREYARSAVVERDNIRALAGFFRTTSPPSDQGEGQSSQDWLCGAPESRKLWSKRSKSQQFALPSNVTLETTAEGRRFAAISPPVSIKNSGPWFQAPETIFKAPTMLDKAAAPCSGPGHANAPVSAHGSRLAGPGTGPGTGTGPGAGPGTGSAAPAPELPPAMWPLGKSSMGALNPSIPSRRSSVGAARNSPNTPPRTGPARRGICISSAAADELLTPAKTRTSLAPAAAAAAAHCSGPPPASTEQPKRPLVTSRRLHAAPSSLGPENPETPPVARGRTQDEEPSWPAGASECLPTASLPSAPADVAARSSSSSSASSNPSMQHRHPMVRVPSGGPVTGSPLPPRKSAKRPPMLSVQPQAQAQTSTQTTQSPVQSMPPPPEEQKQQPTGPLQASSGVLTVPDSNLPPESPGFPNMLAAMTFPSPPSSSRPSTSQSNSIGTITSSQSPQAPSPHPIRRRTSSRQAYGQHPSVLPPASLNEMVMRPDRPRLQHAQSEGAISNPSVAPPPSAASHEPEVSAQSIGAFDEAQPPLRRQSQSSASILIMDDHARPESCSSFATARERPDSVYSAYELGLALRRSTGSDCTAATDSHRQSTTTTDDTQRRSTRSDITAATSVNSTHSDGNDSRATAVAHCDPLGLVTPMEAAGTASALLARVSMGTTDENLQALLSGQNRLSAEDVMAMSAAGELGVPPAQSLLERRMARKASAAEYSHGEGFAAPQFVTDSVDSPVLGWFPDNAARSRLIRSQLGPSPLTPESCPSASLPPDAGDKTPSARELSHGKLAPAGTEFFPQLTPKASRVSMATNLALSWSSTMTVETVPEDPPRSPPSDKGPPELSISPLYIIAHIEPETPAITPKRPRPLSMMFLEHQFAEQQQQKRDRRASQVRPRKQRPLSVKIARNSLTGALERTVSNPPNMNRIPTPPQSPEPRASRRISIVPRLPVALPTPEPTPLSRRVEEASESDSEGEPRQDPAQRIAAIRERLRREKQLKDEEIANMVARTVVSSPSKSEIDDDSEDYHPGEEDNQDEHSAPPDVEYYSPEPDQQPEGIEVPKDDAWTGVMGPLMKKMSKMLLEMQGDGMCSGLRMSEFSFDMEAPEKRVSFYNQTSILVENTKLAAAATATAAPAMTAVLETDPMFDGFDGTHHVASTSTIDEEMAESDQEISPRSLPPGLAKQRLELESPTDEAAEGKGVEEVVIPDVASRATPSLKSPGSLTSLPATPRTPQEQHEQEAQMAILRRIQQQELLMDQLMNKWGTPSTGPWSKPRTDDFGSFSEISQSRDSMTSARPSEDDTRPTTATRGRERSGTGMEMVDPLMREIRRDSQFSVERNAENH